MSTETITRIEDVREDDVATMRSESGTSVTGTVCRVDGGGAISIQLDDVVSQVFAPPTWQFVSATREVTEVEPGATGTATVRGVEGVRVMRLHPGEIGDEAVWASADLIERGKPRNSWDGGYLHYDDVVTDFVPDDPDACGGACNAAVALRRDVERLRGEWKREVEQRGRKALEDQFDEIVSERTATEVERIREAHKRDIQNLGQANVRLRERLERLSGDSVREAIRTAVRDWNATVRQHTTDWPIQAHVPRDLADDVVVRVLRIVMEDA